MRIRPSINALTGLHTAWLATSYVRDYNGAKQFEWNEEKNQPNLRKHGLDFADAHEILGRPTLTVLDDRFEYGEERWIGIGMIRDRVVVVVYTEPTENTTRIISIRKALRHERTRYEQALHDQLGAG